MPALELCPCLDAVFGAVQDADALQRLAQLGFRRFEFWDWRARDIAGLRTRSAELGLKATIFSGNTFAEPLVDPAAHERTLDHLRRSLHVAENLGVDRLVAHVGYSIPGRPRREQWQAAVRGLRQAAALASAEGIVLAVEPLNSRRDHPGYFLDSLADAARLIDDVGDAAVRLLLDVYHMAIMHEEDLLTQLSVAVPLTVHVHVADVPGRGEPGSGTLPWPSILGALEEGGYKGVIGLECWASTTPEAALGRSGQVLRG